MENDDLADLLERELALLDDADDTDDEDAFINEDFLRFRTNDESKDCAVDDDFEQLLLSAKALPNLGDELVPILPNAEFAVEDTTDVIVNVSDASHQFMIDATECIQSPVDTELTEEEKHIITDLMNLMIESVERVAPILARTELSPLIATPSSLGFTETPALTIISDDDTQVEVGLPLVEAPIESDRTAEIDLLDHRLHTEAKLEREARIISSQHNDQVIWDETNQFKQAIEQEKARREERRRNRELAKLTARREKAAEQVQKVLRGFLSRRTFTELQQQHRAAQQHLQMEQALQKQRQEEALREQIRLQDMKNQANECVKMEENESQCRKVWAELQLLQEKQREHELQSMCAEDLLSAQVREIIQEARLKLESFALLAAQEDVEYDLFGDSDSDYSDTESAVDMDSEPKGETLPRYQANSSVFPTPQAPVTGTQTTDAPSGNPINPITTTAAAATTKATYKVVPPKARPTVSVDPRQGRKFGGALINNTTTSSSSSSSVAESNAVEVVRKDTPAVGDSATVNMQSNAIREEIIQKPVMSIAERQSLEAQWHHLVADSYKFTTRSVNYDTASVEAANSILGSCFAKEEPMEKSGDGGNINSSTCALISALHYWQKWYIDYPTSIPSLPAATTTTAAEPLLPQSEEYEEVPHNTMLDTHADPLLLTELECSVEGISSTAFLHKYTNLAKLTLNVNKISQLHGIATLINLHTLSCKDNKLTSIQPLSALTGLKYLYLDANRITDLTPLNGLHNLSVLTVNNNFLCDFPILHCKSLQRLELCRNKLTTIPPHSLRGVPNLTHLNVSSNQIHSICGATLSMCSLLQTLILSENLLTEVPAPLYLPLLKNLRLNLNRIQNLNAWIPSNSTSSIEGSGTTIYPLFVPSLQKLVLSDNSISEINGGVFEMLLLLEECDLSFNAIPTKESVQGITHCKLLHSIHIQDNLFTTVPVNTGAGAGTTRTALPPNLLTSLLHYLVDLCPTLHTVSGNRLDPKEFSERINATCRVYLRNHYLTHHTYLPHDVLIQDLAYTTHSREVRELIQLLHAHSTQQNILTVRERAVKRDEAAAKTNNRIHNIASSASTVKCDWEQENISLFTAQRVQLSTLFANEMSIGSQTAFISFAKNAPVTSAVISAMSVPILIPPDPIIYPVDANSEDGTDEGLSSFYLTESSSHLSAAPIDPKLLHASATHLQRLYRGYKLRRRLGTGFKRIKYHDAELDDLFNNEEFNFENEFNDVLDMSYLEEPPMVYGDHIRKRSRPGTGVKPGSTGSSGGTDGHDTHISDVYSSMNSSSGWVLPTDEKESPKRPKYNVKAGSGLANIHTDESSHTAQNTQYVGGQGAYADSRPDTGLSALTTHSTQQQDGSYTPYSDAPDRAARSFHSGASSPAQSMHSARSGVSDAHSSTRPRPTAAALGQEWGISDPRVLANMLKRSNKIRVAEDVKERRELEKDPLYRLQQFQKTAHTHKAPQPANTHKSGSFGGAPKTMRGNGAGTKRKNLPLPAWMLGAAGQEGEDS